MRSCLTLGTLAMTVAVAGCAHLSSTTPTASGEESSDYLTANVVRVSEEYANINTDVSGTQLSAWGVGHQQLFTVKFKSHTVQPMLGKDYSDVPRGEWIALIEEDGRLQLAISFGHAATEIGCSVGDTLYIQSPNQGE